MCQPQTTLTALLAAALVAAGACSGGGGGGGDGGPGGGPDGTLGDVAAPDVDGEPVADHRRPSWVWTVPDGATGFRARIDEGAWTEVDADITWWTSIDALGNGAHTFQVAARDGAGNYGPAGTFDTEVAPVSRAGDDFWGQARVMTTTSLGHACALSAHNAYVDDQATAAANLDGTLASVHAAQAAGADLIELDIVHAGGRVVIDHDDTGAQERAALADVLGDADLRGGDEIMFLEIKEQQPTDAFGREVLDTIAGMREDYGRAGRHVVLRAFDDIGENLDLLRALLDTPEYVLLRPYVRLSVLFRRDDATAAKIAAAAAAGYDMVELEYRSDGLMSHILRARALGLGTGIFTVPVEFGEVFVANAREVVDQITIEVPVALARSVVERSSSLFLVDASAAADETVESIPYRRSDAQKSDLAVNGDTEPALRVVGGEDPLPGGRLVFEAGASQAAELYDADAPAGQGVLIALSALLGTTALPDGETMVLASKTQTSGWTLELHNPAGGTATVLRFGVYVAGAYHYATVAASALTTERAHFITGAYDGDGGVRLWVDNDAAGVTSESTTGGITNNDLAALLGADPGEPRRFFFDGEIQLAIGQAWVAP